MTALLFRFTLIATFFFASSQESAALFQAERQATGGQTIAGELRELVETPAVSGYEQAVGKKIVARLKSIAQRYQPQPFEIKMDNLGNVMVTFGSGAPRRLLVAPIDEPGFVVSGITPE